MTKPSIAVLVFSAALTGGAFIASVFWTDSILATLLTLTGLATWLGLYLVRQFVVDAERYEEQLAKKIGRR